MTQQHPSLETLLDLTLGELPEAEATEVREHLLSCPDCLEKTRGLLDAPDEPPSEDDRIDDGDRQEAWRRLSSALESQDVETSRESPSEPLKFESRATRREVRGGSRFTPWLAAAATAILSFSLGLLVSKPQPPTMLGSTDTPILGDGSTVRGPEDAEPVNCPPEGSVFTWALVLSEFPEGYQRVSVTVELPDGSSETLELKIDSLGQLGISRFPEATPDGDYSIEVKLPDGTTVETFYLKVECRE